MTQIYDNSTNHRMCHVNDVVINLEKVISRDAKLNPLHLWGSTPTGDGMACDPVLGKFSKSTALEPCPAHSLLKLCLGVRLLFQNDPQASTAQVGFVVSFQRPLSLMEKEAKGRTWPNPTVHTHKNMKNTLDFFYPQMKTCSATKSMSCNKN